MRPKNVLRSALLLLVGLALLAGGGCIFDPSSTDDPPKVTDKPYPTPTTPDELMANFRKAYDELNIQEYRKVLDDNYYFVPLPEDLGDLGLSPGEYVVKAQELAISEKIFSGQAGTDGAPGITDVEVVLLDPVTTWVDSTDPIFPAPAQEALYEVEIRFHHANGYYRVRGQQKFWVVNVPDEGRPHYYLLGQRDFTTAAP